MSRWVLHQHSEKVRAVKWARRQLRARPAPAAPFPPQRPHVRGPAAPRSHWLPGATRDAPAAARVAVVSAVGASRHLRSFRRFGERGKEVGAGLRAALREAGRFSTGGPSTFHPHQRSAPAGRAHSRPQAPAARRVGEPRCAIFSCFAVSCGAWREPGADVFCLLRAGLAGRSMIEEDWNAEIGDEGLLPSLEKVWVGGAAMAMEYVCFSIPSSDPCPCNLCGCWAVVFPLPGIFGTMVGSHRSSLLLKRGAFLCTSNLLAAVDISDCCMLKWAWHVSCV